MADLVVHPSVVVGPEDIITADLLNLLATPIVDLALAEPINDTNYLRNGNFYSSYWTTPAGLSCPVNVETANANYWYIKPQGAAVTSKRSTVVPDTNSLFSQEIDGAVGVTDVEFGQNIQADLSATLRRICTFSGNLFNSSGLVISPKLRIYTANAFNNFTAKTLQTTVDLQTCSNGVWTYVSVTVDLSALTNMTNGVSVVILVPSGALSAVGKLVNFSRLKFQIGEVATEFTDDVSLFVTAPSVDSTMLQDGCIARPSLFLPNVVPTGAYQAGSIKSGDIADGQVMAADLDSGTVLTTTTANFTVPAVNANVAVTVTSATSISSGSTLNIQGAGYYQTVSVAGNVVTTKNLGTPNNAASGTVINSGANVNTQNAVIGSLGYIPVNKAGDTGVGKLTQTIDTVVGATAYASGALNIGTTSANANNTGYFPAIGFSRPSVFARALGLDTSGRFKTIDAAGTVGYLLDTVTKVDANSYQDASINYAKLSQACINTICPCGMIIAYAGGTVPTNWLICDGHWESRTGRPALWAAIGTAWGVADGSLYFALPDLRGRAPIGYCNTAPPSGITARGFGTYFGEESTQLARGHMPVHNHTITDQQHGHTLHNDPHAHSYVNPTGGLGSQPGSGQYSAAGATNTSANAINMWMDNAYSNINHTENDGSNTPHNSMQPIAVCYYIIKAV